MKKSLYEILELNDNATQEGIKKAFYRLSKQYHPDINPDNRGKFEEINHAYQILSDINKKSKYDELGDIDNDIFNVMTEAMERITKDIARYLETSFDFGKLNFKELYLHTTGEAVKECLSDKNIINKKIKDLLEVKKRFVLRNTKEKDILEICLDNVLDSLRVNLEALEKELEVSNKIIEILGNYEYAYGVFSMRTRDFKETNLLDFDILQEGFRV